MKTASEIIIIGGGIIGIAIAIQLKQKEAKVKVLSNNFQKAATLAAAGMLAPQAEAISNQAMLNLCLKSRDLYPDWINKLESLTGLNTGYLPCGILAPIYEQPETKNQPNSFWLDKSALNLYQSGLGHDVIGAWWYPEDGQVDNRYLAKVLLEAATILGVEIQEGVKVEGIQQKQGKVDHIRTSQGEFRAQYYVLAAGAWSHQLWPLPVRPIKGQMLSVRMAQTEEALPIERVLFGPNTYLVPRRDGKLIIGATTEDIGWTSNNTAKGIQTLLNRAIRLYPAMENWPIEELWWGFRPSTPDELPILGTSNCENLFLATGHYRNGILLAPVTASLLTDLILDNYSHPLLTHFSCDRFYKQLNPTSLPLVMTNSYSSLPSYTNGSNGSSVAVSNDDQLTIAGRTFKSRLMTGSGKYSSLPIMQESIAASKCQIVTVAVRRVQTKAPGHEGLAEAIDWSKIWMLPNTAGCQTAEEAIRVARLGREMAKLLGQEDNNFIKLEVIPDAKYLLPDPIGTLQAAEQLVKEGFAVLPYINADPILAKRLEEVGCATVMPLGSPIGSGQGIKNAANIKIIIEQAHVPVVIDAGIGTPSEAAYGMELGADALLINSAIALSPHPVAMAKSMNLAAKAGRLAFLAGRMPIKEYASASSPLTGVIQ